MATPNYGYEKRQRELAKRKKKEEKLKSKTERKLGDDPAADAEDQANQAADPNSAPAQDAVAGGAADPANA